MRQDSLPPQDDAPRSRTERIFSLRSDNPQSFGERLLHSAASPLERILGLLQLDSIYARCVKAPDPIAFLKQALEDLNISYSVLQEDLERIPKTGPVVVVANHPFGALEGLILSMILQIARPDSKIMANFILQRIKPLQETFLFVDPFDSATSTTNNIGPLRQAMRWLKDGHLLGVFPAGEVAHLHLRQWEVTDPPWSDTISRIIRKSGSPVLPVFFRGSNSALFHFLGLMHPRLRTVMLPRELLRKKHTKIEVRIGSLIPPKRIASMDSDSDVTAYLRHRTFMLQHRTRTAPPAPSAMLPHKLQPVVDAVPAEDLDAEVQTLAPDSLLLQHDQMQVFYARAHEIPNILREIGRLREITFRATGEGTGKAIDIDQFDQTYGHLWVWNKTSREIVGAYRLGLTDEILPESGKDGLYTATLFDYKPGLLERIDPALEMGRSFVRPEYQRSYTPLLLLWKGIGRFVVRNKRYKILFGPVSISNTYQTVSRQLMIEFLRVHNPLPALAQFVEARNPFRLRRKIRGCDRPVVESLVKDSDDVSDIIADIEWDQKGLPVLIRHYLKLNAKMLAFNLDPDFSDVVDALILVDLRTTDLKLISRYMGRDGAREFRAFHGIPV